MLKIFSRLNKKTWQSCTLALIHQRGICRKLESCEIKHLRPKKLIDGQKYLKGLLITNKITKLRHQHFFSRILKTSISSDLPARQITGKATKSSQHPPIRQPFSSATHIFGYDRIRDTVNFKFSKINMEKKRAEKSSDLVTQLIMKQ